jgi:hypothetical protein
VHTSHCLRGQLRVVQEQRGGEMVIEAGLSELEPSLCMRSQ